MIQFPETAWTEWTVVANAAQAETELRARIERDTQVEKKVEELHRIHEAKLIFQQELDAADTPPVVIQTMEDFLKQNTPALVDLIDGVVKEDGVTLLLGPAGTGKSTLAVQMMHSLLTGTDWLGQPTKPLMGSVGLMSYDQNVAIPINWMSQMGVPHDRVSPLDLNGKGNPLNVPSERQRIASAWRLMNVEVVFIDSFSASFSGDQNDAGLVMEWYKTAKKFALTEVGAKALVVLVHSTDNNPVKPRGSTAHKDVADSIVVVQRGENNRRSVSMEKYREGLNQIQMPPVIVTAPDSVTHLVDLDYGAMSLAGMPLPQGAVAAQFPALPDTHEAPETTPADIDWGEEKEDDL